MKQSPRTWVLALASIASLMVALDTLVVSTALNTIREDLAASVEELEWTVNAYNLSLAVLLLPAAALGDRFGRRRLFAAGLGLFAASSAACALAPDVGWLIAARAVQGVGAAFVLSLSLALVSAAYPPERRGWAVGVLEGIAGVAVLAGPTLGGAVAHGLSWEWIFWINVPIGAAVVPLVLTRIEEGPERRPAPLDIPGVALVSAGAFGLVWGLVRGNHAGWASPEVTLALAAGLLLVGAFVAWEHRTSAPMLPLRLFRRRGFSAGNVAVFCLFGSIFAGVFFFAQFMQIGLGHDALEAGLSLLPWTAPLFLIAPDAGALADRIGDRPVLVAGMTLEAVGMAWVALIAEPGMSYGELVVPLLVAGLGASMAIPPAAGAVLRAAPAEAAGPAAGANSMLRELGGVFGIAAAVAIFAGAGGYTSAAAFTDGFAAATAFAAALALAGALAGLVLPGRPHSTAPPRLGHGELASQCE
jgi:EmrB/QacA subfamily drug resistance transporter